MILSDQDIAMYIDDGTIRIDPFDPKCLGPNSYDVHLGSTLMHYVPRYFDGSRADNWMPGNSYPPHAALSCKDEHETKEIEIRSTGQLLHPGVLYLASTLEYTETHHHIPYLDGKSSVGRLGMAIHVTAGRGDIGFCGHWTMEIFVIHPVVVFAGMPIGQLTYHMAFSQPVKKYGAGVNVAAYNNRDPKPQPSRMWKNFR